MKYFLKAPFFIFSVALLIGLVWFFKSPSDQELLANMAKAEDFHPWITWWSSKFMGGGSVAPQLTTIFTILPLKFSGFFLGPLLGGKTAGLAALFCAGLAMNLFLGDWTKNKIAGLFGAFAYVLGPQMGLRLGGNEHLPVVFSMVYAPLVLWSLWNVIVYKSWKASFFLSVSYGALLLSFTKMALCFAPIAIGFALILGYQFRKELCEPGVISLIGLRFLGAGMLLVPLAIIPLLPVFREYSWLALFTYEPFQQWQNNFSLQGFLGLLDRNQLLTSGMPANFNLDQGGFYLGIMTIILAWNVFSSQKEISKSLKQALKISIGLLFLSAWLSLGPVSFASRMLGFLNSSQGLQNAVLPLFWIMFIAPIVLLWKLWPCCSNAKQRNTIRIIALLFFLFIPGFKLLELLPLAQGIRAPWSVWQIGGSIFVAALFGCAASFFITSFHEKKLQKILGVALLLFLTLDFSSYLSCYYRGALREGTYDDFLKTVAFFKQDPSHNSVIALSGRYFYLQIPTLSGHPLIDESFNRYFGLKWIRSLENTSNVKEVRELLNLLGASYVFIDKEDPVTPKQIQDFYRSLYPVVFENNSFVVLENHDSLYPAFLAHDFVVVPVDSYTSFASASLQLASMNLLTLEMVQPDLRELGFAGVAKGNNQIELLPNYKEHGGAPFQRIDLMNQVANKEDQIIYHLPPAASGWLVVTKAFHPDWKGGIDGQSSKTYRAAGALLSLYVPLNSQEIVFKFTPPFWYSLSFYIGMFSWFLALVMLYLILSGSNFLVGKSDE